MNVKTIMRVQPWTIADTDTLGTAQQIMLRESIRHLPVMSAGRIVGILSERDVFAARANSTEPWWRRPVRGAMSTPVHTAHPDDPVVEVAGRLARSKIGAMPVVELGKLVGLVTVSDVLEAEVVDAMGAG
jgi:acetoin utilization protein AcuB